MQREIHEQIIEQKIVSNLEALFPLGEGRVTRRQAERAIREVAQVAFREGANYALLSLMTVANVAEQLGVSERRVRAILADQNKAGHAIGWQVPGTNAWLIRPEEIEQLRPRPTAGRPPSKPRGEIMKNHWVQVRIDHGELVADAEENTDLYLTTIREWYSPDGQTWERQPDCYEVFTGGTTDPIGRYGPTRTWTLDEVLAQHNQARPGLDIDRYVEPTVELVKWSVDSAGIRREFAAETEPDDPEYTG